MIEARTVLVTGATGFVGRHVCASLRERGLTVRGLHRPGSAQGLAGVEPVLVRDLLDREGIRRAVQGIDAVIHLAARVHVMLEQAADPLAEFRRTNVEGTRVLLEEARDAGAGAFVFISSVKALGEANETPWTEDSPPAPVDPYGISKLEAERLVREMADEEGMHAPILRLPLVYGPEMKGNMLRLFEVVDRGTVLPFGSIRNRRSLAYVGNVSAAIEAVLATPEARRETFLVSDGHDLSTPELVREIARALDRPARLVPVPPWLFRVAGWAGDVLSHLAPVPLTSAAVDRLIGSLAVDSSRLGRVTGFRTPHSVPDAMQATGSWFRTRRERTATASGS